MQDARQEEGSADRISWARLSRRASKFELAALLKALLSLGFDTDEIRFEGVRDLESERGPLIRELIVEQAPRRLATIRLNAGLLSQHSPLPEYFRDFARRLPNPDEMLGFLGFWDSALLRDFAFSALPQFGVARTSKLSSGYQARVIKANPMILHGMFRGLFPELPVEVSFARFPRNRMIARARIGAGLDGQSVLGAQFRERQSGFRIKLHADSECCEGVRDWEREAKRRLTILEPTLSRLTRPVEVVLRFASYRYGHSLVDQHYERPQLGVRPWLAKARSQTHGPGEVLVRGPWAGQLAES